MDCVAVQRQRRRATRNYMSLYVGKKQCATRQSRHGFEQCDEVMGISNLAGAPGASRRIVLESVMGYTMIIIPVCPGRSFELVIHDDDGVAAAAAVTTVTVAEAEVAIAQKDDDEETAYDDSSGTHHLTETDDAPLDDEKAVEYNISGSRLSLNDAAAGENPNTVTDPLGDVSDDDLAFMEVRGQAGYDQNEALQLVTFETTEAQVVGMARGPLRTTRFQAILT
ncbi:hypothetical protein CC86DRAFT_426096 [Ophiobolus disseminans]|uniref:Uncharacterized protein n=1 Tax=Ophiobolus disseminans TaxID=1469910 RepID=A0A6A6ZL96_9PLEO|nr:hypothetical protein CC86DRAFT_426096 [Ophiobolus disseminans]